MAFLPKFADREGYTDANIYEFERRRERPRQPTSSVSWSPESVTNMGGGSNFGSRGMLDQVGRAGRNSGGGNPTAGLLTNPTAGLLGIQNTTGFAQEGPNVVYDQQPEQFEKDLKLRNRLADIEKTKAEGLLEQNKMYNSIRQQNADTGLMRAQIQDYKARNPNAIIKEMADGMYAIDPQTNQVTRIGEGLGMPARERMGQQFAGDYMLQQLRNAGLLGAAQASQGAQGERLNQTLGANREETQIEQSGMNFRNLVQNQDPAGAAMRVFNTNPELRPFIQMSEDGKTFSLKVPGQTTKNWMGQEIPDPSAPTPQQAEMLKKMIYGDVPQAPKIPPYTPPTRQNAPALNSVPGGSVGSVLPGAAPPVNPQEMSNTLQLNPNQMQGFSATPGQYNAQPGQYTPQGQAPPMQGGVGGPTGEAPEEVKQAAVQYLRGKGLAITPESIAQITSQMMTRQQGGPTFQGRPVAGVTGQPAAGTVSGLGAGRVR